MWGSLFSWFAPLSLHVAAFVLQWYLYADLQTRSVYLWRKGNCESRNAGTRNGTRNGSNVVSHRKYTEMMQEVTISQRLLRVTAQPSFVGPAAYPQKEQKHLNRSREVFPLEPVNRFALTEVNIAKRNSQLRAMQISPPDFARLYIITVVSR